MMVLVTAIFVILFATLGVMAFEPQLVEYIEDYEPKQAEPIELRPYIDYTIE